MIKRPFILIFVFFSLGVFSGEKLVFSFVYILPLALLFFLGLIVLSFQNKKSLIIPLGFFYFAGIVFILPYSKSSFNSRAENFNLYKKEKREITAVITDFPSFSYSRLKTKIKLKSIDGKNLESENFKLSLSIYNYEKDYKPGDLIFFNAQIKPYKNFRNPGSFDYKSYMRFKGFFGHTWVSDKKVELIGKENSFQFFITKIRARFVQSIDENIKKPLNSEFLKSITCGLRTGLDQEFKDKASKAGASHFMAISGLHIGMVFSFFFILSRFVFSRFEFFLWRGWVEKSAVILGLLGALFYALISGLMPSAQRSFILALLGGAGFFLNKNQDPLNLLFCCGFFILVLTPPFLFNLGFILSFLAVFAIVSGFMTFPEKFEKNPDLFSSFYKWIKVLFKTSAFAVAGTSPAALYYFNILPLTGVFSGIILIPFFSFILLPFAFGGILFSFIFPEVSKIFFLIGSFSVDIFIKMISIISDFKFTYINMGISIVELFLIYLILIIVFWGIRFFIFQSRPGVFFKVLAGFTLVILICDVLYEVDKRFFNKHGKIVFLDIGKGNSALIVFPGGKTVVIDSGGFPGSSFDTGRYILGPYLFKNKIKTIDCCISTHGDYDHYSGFFYLIEQFKIKKFVFNNTLKDSGLYEKLILETKKRGIFSKPEKIEMKNGFIDFFQREELFNNENDNSLLISVFINGLKILFTGDLYKKSQDYYKETDFIKNSDVFMVPHHGSIHSLNKDFVIAANPKLGIISGSFRNFEKTQKQIKEIYSEMGVKTYNINNKGALVSNTEEILNKLTFLD